MKAALLLACAAALAAAGHPNAGNCTEKWFTQTVDHFSWVNSQNTYQQRYYVYDALWSHKDRCPKRGEAVGPIFFYTGNEGDVTMYVNATGLMWENAAQFGALLVWAEHRYYGQSQPFGPESDDDPTKNLQFLTHEQALADYATLLPVIKAEAIAALVAAHPECEGTVAPADIPVITFGGSYGGMLSAWFRMKYPGLIDGAIAASAPILKFPGVADNYSSNAYWKVVTADASSPGGASDSCAVNVKNSWQFLFQQAQTPSGQAQLSTVFQTCTPVKTAEDGYALAISLLNAWDSMAMGEYPYPFNYMTGGGPMLPAYPVRVACGFISDPSLSGWDLMAAAAAAAAVYNNASGSLPCNPLPTDLELDGIWDYQWCTEMLPEETYFTYGGPDDMFWYSPYNASFVNAHCSDKYGIEPRPNWIAESYGTVQDIARYASNIVFTNGELDPWSSGGVTQTLSPSLPAIMIEGAGHHLDLFFSNPADPPSVTGTRKFQMNTISNWLASRAASRAQANA